MQKPDKEWDLAPVEDSDMGKTSLDLAFHFVPRSYEWATSRIQAVERRADSTITWVVSVNLAFVAVVAAVLKGVTAWQVLSTIPFVAGLPPRSLISAPEAGSPCGLGVGGGLGLGCCVGFCSAISLS